MQTLIEFARAELGDDIILFTTDGGDTGLVDVRVIVSKARD